MKRILVMVLLFALSAPAQFTVPMRTGATAVAPSSGGATVTDDFNRANGALGSNWTTTSWGLSYAAPAVVSNQMAGNTAWKDGVVMFNANFANDQWLQADIVAFSSNTLHLFLRTDGTTKNGYGLFVATSGNLTIRKYTNGSAGFLKNCSTVTAGQTVKFSATGSTLSVLINGSDGCTGGVTDTTFTSGKVGAWLGAQGTAPGDKIDNFSAGPTQ